VFLLRHGSVSDKSYEKIFKLVGVIDICDHLSGKGIWKHVLHVFGCIEDKKHMQGTSSWVDILLKIHHPVVYPHKSHPIDFFLRNLYK